VTSAPIVVHRPALSGGQRGTVHSHGQAEILDSFSELTDRLEPASEAS